MTHHPTRNYRSHLASELPVFPKRLNVSRGRPSLYIRYLPSAVTDCGAIQQEDNNNAIYVVRDHWSSIQAGENVTSCYDFP